MGRRDGRLRDRRDRGRGVNGTVVGGLAGLVIYTVAQLFGWRAGNCHAEWGPEGSAQA